MGTEAIVIPILVDPKQGVAGLQELGRHAERTGQQMDGASTGSSKFGDSMKRLAGNIFQAIGIMKIADAVTKELVGSFVEYVNGAYRMVDAQKMIAKSHEEAAANTRDEVVELQALISVARNTELSYSQRQGALDRLIKQHPDYLRGLTLEKLATQEATDAVNKLSQALVRQEQIKIIIKQIAELENGLKLLESINKNTSWFGVLNSLTKDTGKFSNQINELKGELASLMADTYKVDLPGKLGSGAGGEINIKPDKAVISPKKTELKPDFKTLEQMAPGFILNMQAPPEEIRQQAYKFGEAFATDLRDYFKRTEGTDFSLLEVLNKTDQKGSETVKNLMSEYEAMADMITGTLTPAIDDMFSAILAGEDPLKEFFSGINRSITQLVSKLIQMAAYAGILSLISGGAAGGGISFMGAFKKVLGFAEGGLVTGPVSALVGEGHGTSRSNPEVVAPLDRLQTFFSNMVQGNQGFGTPAGMGLAGSIVNMPERVELIQRGRDMYAVLELQRQHLSRTAG